MADEFVLDEKIEKMRKDLGLPPTCPKCRHSNWTYKKSLWSWACQIHGWLEEKKE